MYVNDAASTSLRTTWLPRQQNCKAQYLACAWDPSAPRRTWRMVEPSSSCRALSGTGCTEGLTLRELPCSSPLPFGSVLSFLAVYPVATQRVRKSRQMKKKEHPHSRPAKTATAAARDSLSCESQTQQTTPYTCMYSIHRSNDVEKFRTYRFVYIIRIIRAYVL